MAAATTDEFSSAWESFFRATRRARARTSGSLGSSGLSLPQYQLLERLRDADALTVSELATSAGVTPPSATRMLDVLVREGIAERRAAEYDRRAVLISLTPAGREVVASAAERIAAARRRVRDSRSPEEQAQAARLLRRLADVIEQQSL